jgi:hypothetical protein
MLLYIYTIISQCVGKIQLPLDHTKFKVLVWSSKAISSVRTMLWQWKDTNLPNLATSQPLHAANSRPRDMHVPLAARD